MSRSETDRPSMRSVVCCGRMVVRLATGGVSLGCRAAAAAGLELLGGFVDACLVNVC